MYLEDIFAEVFLLSFLLITMGIFIYALITQLNWNISSSVDEKAEVRVHKYEECTCSKDDDSYNVLYNRFTERKDYMTKQEFEQYKKKVMGYEFPM